jgi:hypothetical protein
MAKPGRPTKEELENRRSLFEKEKNEKDQEDIDNIEFTPDPNNNDDIKDTLKDQPTAASNSQETIEKEPLLSSPVVENDYTKTNARVEGPIPDEIPEPIIEQPVINFNEQPEFTDSGLSGPDPGEQLPPKPDRGEVKNPALDEASTRQKTAAAGYLVETVINAYVAINNLGKNYCTFSQDKMNQMAMDGKFDFAILDLEIPLSEEGDSIKIGEFLDQINEQSAKVFIVSEEFKEQARPLLMKIFKDKGWGMTPEQRLIALVVEDAAPKVAVMIAIRSQFNALIKMGTQIIQMKKDESRPTHTAGPVRNTDSEDLSKVEFVPTEEVKPDISVDQSGNYKEPE